jgi:hypothetical protein
MRLYVWEGVLADWCDGIAFAFASSPEQAVELLSDQIGADHFDGLLLDGVAPREVVSPEGFHLYGSA